MRISVEDSETHDLETERRAAIALLKQQLTNLLDLYKNAIITTEEYYRDRADRERQIAFWEARTTEHRKKAIELEQVMVAFSQLLDLWSGADSDERSRLAASLFQYLVIDLDKEQIVDFRLHAWADQYLCLRAELYDDGDSGAFGGGSEDNEAGEGNENRFTTVESDEAIDDPNGTSGHKTVHERLLVAKRRILAAIHIRVRKILSGNLERDLVVRARYLAGETLSSLAHEFGLTPQRVFQIINV